jgi:antitoxin MazE6
LIKRYYLGYTFAVKTAVSIPDPLFRAAERLAKRLGMPRSRLYSRAIERYVSETQERDVTALLNQVYAKETAELDSALAALQWASIPREQW